MEFFTIAAGVSVHVWDTRDERCPVKPDSDCHARPDRTSLPTLVFLHGYLETMYIYNELVETLKDRYRLIVIDLPGHGLTDSAPADEAFLTGWREPFFSTPIPSLTLRKKRRTGNGKRR